MGYLWNYMLILYDMEKVSSKKEGLKLGKSLVVWIGC